MSASVAEDYDGVQKHMTADPVDAEAALPHFKNLLSAINSADTNPLLLVKALQTVGTYGAHFEESCLKDCMQAFVKIFSSQDEQAVLLAGVQGLTGFCRKCIELGSKKGEFVVRESTDILLQLSLDEERPAAVRKAADNGYPILISCDFKAVVIKLLHWISDDREDDDAEYLAAERSLALNRLTSLVGNKAYLSQWTDEVYQHILKFVPIILPTITLSEYSRFVSCMAAVPQVKSNNCVPLVDAVLSPSVKYTGNAAVKTARVIEMLTVLGAHIPRGTVHDGLAQRVLQEIPKISATEDMKNTITVKATLLGARCCSDAVAEKMVPAVVKALKTITAKVKFDEGQLPANLTILEGLLVSLNALGHKSTLPFYDAIAKEDVNNMILSVHRVVAGLINKAVFAVKKMVVDKKASTHQANMLSNLNDLKTITEFLGEKKLAPATTAPSWEKRNHLPKLKHSVGGPKQQQQQAGGLYKAGQGQTTFTKRAAKRGRH